MVNHTSEPGRPAVPKIEIFDIEARMIANDILDKTMPQDSQGPVVDNAEKQPPSAVVTARRLQAKFGRSAISGEQYDPYTELNKRDEAINTRRKALGEQTADEQAPIKKVDKPLHLIGEPGEVEREWLTDQTVQVRQPVSRKEIKQAKAAAARNRHKKAHQKGRW